MTKIGYEEISLKLKSNSSKIILSQRYYFPNGDLAPSRPSDAQVFYEWDTSTGCAIGTWIWDDRKVQWIKLNKSIAEDEYDLEKSFKSMLNCECGAEKCGSNRHSSWCNKYA